MKTDTTAYRESLAKAEPLSGSGKHSAGLAEFDRRTKALDGLVEARWLDTATDSDSQTDTADILSHWEMLTRPKTLTATP